MRSRLGLRSFVATAWRASPLLTSGAIGAVVVAATAGGRRHSGRRSGRRRGLPLIGADGPEHSLGAAGGGVVLGGLAGADDSDPARDAVPLSSEDSASLHAPNVIRHAR